MNDSSIETMENYEFLMNQYKKAVSLVSQRNNELSMLYKEVSDLKKQLKETQSLLDWVLGQFSAETEDEEFPDFVTLRLEKQRAKDWWWCEWGK